MLDKKKPREQSGRDSYSRYRYQVRSAAIASLSILEGGDVDMVYCDLHDDFVIRKFSDGKCRYVFVQVKTNSKQNHNWGLSEIFGLNTRLPKGKKQENEKIKDSFVGKMLLHTVGFGEHCEAVVFQTNIHSADVVEEVLADIASGVFGNKYSIELLDRFNDCFNDSEDELSRSDVENCLSKIGFEHDVYYLKSNEAQFESAARDKIYEFSEVDLQRTELRQIILKLLDLVSSKSSGVITSWDSESIDSLAGVSIADLLSVLSVSKTAYQELLSGGDSKAIKSASIIQRSLSKGGADHSAVEYCSRCKVSWDVWLRTNRHVVRDFDLLEILERVKDLLYAQMDAKGALNITLLRGPVESLLSELHSKGLAYDLDENLLLGCVFSELVKGET
ncbi:dsDNA nuclease domain-containing protein [Halopseudomonas sabulinigri]|uniref:CD-NTase associated protein 4-like DNA endonuclease domain-containing protein n=1 Tax=Halopseudomonas sabulinigri TaxID=472181 RepID=A0ABP9ZTK4_9GAMM